MSRNRRQRSGIVGRLLVLLILLGIIGGVAYLGPDRAMKVGLAGATSNFFNRPIEADEHRLRVLDIHVDERYLDELNADPPWSGGVQKPAVLIHNGIEHPARFRYRGVVATTHFLGDKKSFRLTMKRSNPFGPIKKLNLINPKSFNMMNDHMALWVAGQMGVPVPYNELVFVRLNDKDYGVMELFEQIDGDIARTRNMADDDIPVFKGDFPPVTGNQLPASRSLWANAAHWQYASDADSAIAKKQLQALVQLLQPDTLSWGMKRDSLNKLIDVDAFLRYCAAIKVINTVHIDNYHNQWLVFKPREQRFMPVLWDALMMFPPVDEPLYFNHDALAYWLLRDPEWRVQRDRYIHQALQRMTGDSLFLKYYASTLEDLRSSMLHDQNKYGVLTTDADDVHEFSSLHFAKSADKLRKRTLFYWDQLAQQFNAPSVSVRPGDGSLRISFGEKGAVRVEVPKETDQKPLIFAGTDTISVREKDDHWMFHVVPEVRFAGAEKESPLADRTRYEPQPVDRTLTIVGADPQQFRYYNAITDEQIQTKR